MERNYSPIHDLDIFDLENSFYLRSDVSRLGKLLAHYELYKKIIEMPGSVVECGVFKGASFVRWATFRHCLETDESRELIGFDAFGSFPTIGLTSREDQEFARTHDDLAGSPGISREGLVNLLQQKGFRNFSLFEGNVLETVQAYLENHAYERIALLHLDLDVFEPTLHVLEQFWERLVPGGVVVIDDYAAVSGATQAVDQFTQARGISLHRASFYKVPSYFFK